MELASDHKDFATALAKTRVAEMNSHGSNIIPVVPLTPHPIPQQQVPHLPAKQKNTSAFLSATSRLPGKVIGNWDIFVFSVCIYVCLIQLTDQLTHS